MKLKKSLTSIPWGYLLITILLAAAGIVLLAFPEDSLQWAVRVVGILTVLLFIIRAVIDISAFAHGDKGVKQAVNVLCDVLALICGGLFIFNPDGALPYLFSVLGLYLIIDGSFKLQTTMTLHQYKMIVAWFLLPFAILNIGLGFILVKLIWDNAKLNAILLGIGLISDAICQLISLFVMPAIHAKRRKEGFNEQTAINDERREKEERIAARREERANRKNKHSRKNGESDAAEAPESAETEKADTAASAEGTDKASESNKADEGAETSESFFA